MSRRAGNWVKRGRVMLFSCVILLMAPLCRAEYIAVITHPDNPLSEISRKQLSNLYLGRNKAIENNRFLELYDHPDNSAIREDFFERLNGMSLSRVNAYWARLRFTGRIFPPTSLLGDDEVIEAVKHNKQALSYVDGESVTADVKVILWLK